MSDTSDTSDLSDTDHRFNMCELTDAKKPN